MMGDDDEMMVRATERPSYLTNVISELFSSCTYHYQIIIRETVIIKLKGTLWSMRSLYLSKELP